MRAERASINRYAWGTLRTRADEKVHITSFDLGLSLAYSSHRDLVYDGQIDLAKAAVLRLGGAPPSGFDLFLHADAPPGSGLGSSSAMVVTLVGVLKELRALPSAGLHHRGSGGAIPASRRGHPRSVRR